ncbi:hypothetical protein STENM327S_04886 [Streptomyces tendae]
MLEELAVLGGAALVSAVTSDIWESVRSGFTRLVRRGDREEQRQITRILNSAPAEIAEAEDDAERQQAAEEGLAQDMTRELTQFLTRHPDAADELRALVDEVRRRIEARPAAPAGQVNNAYDNAVQYITQSGDINVNGVPRR